MNDKTAALIASRGNPERLIATCMSLYRLAQKPRLLEFCIRADLDDTDTHTAALRLEKHMPVDVFLGPRPMSLGAEIEMMVKRADAGFYHVLNDDVLPLTCNWDAPQFEMRKRHPAFVSCWVLPEVMAATGRMSPDYPVVTREWIDAAGRLFTPYFPYWFDDRWLADVWMLATGKTIVPLAINMSARKRRTQRMRDLDFWFSFYQWLEDERVAQAQRAADALGFKVDVRRDRAGLISFLRTRHDEDRKSILETHRRLFDPGEPDVAYLAAKAFAEQRMQVAA